MDSKTRPRNVTLLDIADHCGVSRATVSLVLRNSPKVADETRATVQAAMAALGYVYNRGAARMRSGESRTYGLVIPNIVNPFFAGVTAGITAALDEMDRMVLIVNTLDDPKRQEKFLNQLREYGVDGVIICPASGTRGNVGRRLDAQGMRFVQVLRRMPGYSGDYVSTDYRRVIELAVEHLVERGRRHIGYVGTRLDHSAQHERRESFAALAARHGLDSHVCESDSLSREDGRRATRQLLDTHPGLDGLVLYSDTLALGAIKAIEDTGRVPGRDVAIIGCDDLEEGQFSHPPITTIHLDATRVGRRAADMLFESVSRREPGRSSVLIEPALVIRDSCPHA